MEEGREVMSGCNQKKVNRCRWKGVNSTVPTIVVNEKDLLQNSFS